MKSFAQIPFTDVTLLPKLISDYISGNESVQPFYQFSPDINETEKIIAGKQNEKCNRSLLQQVLVKQYQNTNCADVVSNNINSLQNENTFCVVTAHQLNIFTGPLYYIVKIACTISACRQLNTAYPHYHFVPVYWMGSEDHDFDEINHIHIYNKKVEWTDKQGGATGNYNPESINAAIDEIQQILGASTNTSELIDLYRNAYSKVNLSEATRYLLHQWFGKYGLLIIDGNDADLKRQFIPIMKDEIEHQPAYRLVNEQLVALEENNYKQQAYPREINLFYLQQNSRERIVFHPEDNLYHINNSDVHFSKDALLSEMDNFPERFSPNVILRPLYQQKTLPAIAYIGGAGELCYWLQLKKIFQYHNVQFPQLLLRNSIIILSGNDIEKWQKAKFAFADFFKNTDELKRDYVQQHNDSTADLTDYKNKLKVLYAELEAQIAKSDTTLKNSVGAELQKTLQGLETLEKKILKSLKQQHETELNRVEKIKNKTFPNGIFQERYENFSMYYAQSGTALIETLINETNVYANKIVIIES